MNGAAHVIAPPAAPVVAPSACTGNANGGEDLTDLYQLHLESSRIKRKALRPDPVVSGAFASGVPPVCGECDEITNGQRPDEKYRTGSYCGISAVFRIR